MKAFIATVIFLGLTSLGYAQTNHGSLGMITLTDVVVTPANMSYLNTVRDVWTPKRAYLLQERAAVFDITVTDEYQDGVAPFLVIFYGLNGQINARYNENGHIISAEEQFNDVALPVVVLQMIHEEHPGWEIKSDKYVNKYRDNTIVKRNYELKLGKDKLRKKITINLLAVRD